MTINALDLTEAHQVWPEQAEGFEPLPPRPFAMDPAERDLSARLMAVLMAQKLGVLLAEWQALPASERFAVLQDAEREMAGALSQVNEVAASGLRVVKGPGGRWFVRRGTEKVAGGFATEDEASAVADKMGLE